MLPPRDLWPLVVSFGCDIAVALFVPWVLLAGAVHPRLLAPGATLFALLMLAARPVAAAWLPRALDSSSDLYWSMGVAFTYIAILYVGGALLPGHVQSSGGSSRPTPEPLAPGYGKRGRSAKPRTRSMSAERWAAQLEGFIRSVRCAWRSRCASLGEAPGPRNAASRLLTEKPCRSPSPSNTSTAARSKTEPPAERPSRGRAVAVVICVVLAGLLTTPAAVAYWGQRTLNDTERYVATVDPLVASPEVQDVIATRVTAAIEKQVDIEAILNRCLRRGDHRPAPSRAAGRAAGRRRSTV